MQGLCSFCCSFLKASSDIPTKHSTVHSPLKSVQIHDHLIQVFWDFFVLFSPTTHFWIITLLHCYFKAKKRLPSAVRILLGSPPVTPTVHYSLHPLCQFTDLGTNPSLINFYAQFCTVFSRTDVSSLGLHSKNPSK